MEIHSNSWIFQNDATTTGNGTSFQSGRNDQLTIYITGTSTSRTIIFEGSDGESTPNWYPIPAIKLPTLTSATSTTGTNESWVINLAHWVLVRCRISTIVGGTVRITGRVVDVGASLISGGNTAISGSTIAVPVDIQYNQLTAAEALPVQLSGSILQEQKTNTDAVANVITMSANISASEIYHEAVTWQTFIVNGVTFQVPAGGYRTPVGGTPGATVTIPTGLTCLVGRLT